MYRKFGDEPFCWTPQVVASMPVPQLWALYIADDPDGWQPGGTAEVLEVVNARRAEKGLPPIQGV